MAMNTASREYTSDYARELLISSLERINKFRKDAWELREIFTLEIPDGYIEEIARDLVSKLLDDFSPGNIDSLINEIRSGRLQLHYSNTLKGDGSHEQL
jgi:hypothetical protein